jgi:hypothetical protein
MDIDRACKEAMDRVNAAIEKSAKLHSKALFRFCYPTVQPGIPTKEPQQEITLTIHNRTQFYQCVRWCDNQIGKGSQYWTVRGKVLKFIDPSKKAYDPPAVKVWVIFVPGIDITPLIGYTTA